MSDSEDDWETADVPEGTFVKVDSAAIEAAEAEAAAAKARASEEARKEEAVKRAADAKRAEEEAARRERGERPMILVDFTALDPNIHNRADKHAVNDVDAASALRRRIESEYSTFANDAKLVAAGTVRACSQGCTARRWRSSETNTRGTTGRRAFPHVTLRWRGRGRGAGGGRLEIDL